MDSASKKSLKRTDRDIVLRAFTFFQDAANGTNTRKSCRRRKDSPSFVVRLAGVNDAFVAYA